MPQTWQGHYFDGRTAERHPVTIQPTRTGLHITNAQGHTILWPYHQIRQTQGSYEGEQVRLETGGELSEAVVVPDPTFLTAMHKVAGTLTSHVHDPSRRNARLGQLLGHRFRVRLVPFQLFRGAPRRWSIYGMQRKTLDSIPANKLERH